MNYSSTICSLYEISFCNIKYQSLKNKMSISHVPLVFGFYFVNERVCTLPKKKKGYLRLPFTKDNILHIQSFYWERFLFFSKMETICEAYYILNFNNWNCLFFKSVFISSLQKINLCEIIYLFICYDEILMFLKILCSLISFNSIRFLKHFRFG